MSVFMDKKEMKRDCVKNGQYTTPHLNDKLYLHYKGYSKIENLEEYTGVKALFLEGNGLSKIEGLEAQTEVRSLYLQENVFDVIEGLESMKDLDTLNLSKNYITKIENLSHCKALNSLNLAHNKISTASGIEHILEIPTLQTLDIQHNKLNSDDGEDILNILEKMPDLRVLYLMGNPCVKSIKNYRRSIIYRCKNLRYLDERPVFEEERRRTNAWGIALYCENGTIEAAQAAERDMLNTIRNEKKEADDRNYHAFQDLMKEGLEIRKAKEATAALEANGGIGIENTNTNSNINPFSGEEVVPVPENPDLKKLREQRWGNGDGAVSGLSADIPPPLPPAMGGDVDEPRVVELDDDLPPPPIAVAATPVEPAAPQVDLCELD
jgi:dynein assembly factor 1, axonemal